MANKVITNSGEQQHKKLIVMERKSLLFYISRAELAQF